MSLWLYLPSLCHQSHSAWFLNVIIFFPEAASLYQIQKKVNVGDSSFVHLQVDSFTENSHHSYRICCSNKFLIENIKMYSAGCTRHSNCRNSAFFSDLCVSSLYPCCPPFLSRHWGHTMLHNHFSQHRALWKRGGRKMENGSKCGL